MLKLMTLTLRRWLIVVGLAFLAVGHVSAAEISLVIVSSDHSAAYLEAASALLAELRRGDTSISDDEVKQMLIPEWPSSAALRPRMFVALGTQACSELVKKKIQLHCCARYCRA